MSTLPANALATRKEVKDFMNINQADATIDNLFHDLIGRVSQAFESYCSRVFRALDYTEYYDGDGGNSIFPNQFPINSIASIHDDSDWVWGSDTLIDSSDYRVVDDRYIYYNGVFSKSPQSIKLVYNAGYSAIQTDLKQACIEEVARKYRHRKEIDESVKTLGDGSVSFVDFNFMPQTIITLNQYRINANI